jgi:hypothetical protein
VIPEDILVKKCCIWMVPVLTPFETVGILTGEHAQRRQGNDITLNWPSHSPDLRPLHYYVYGQMKGARGNVVG